MNLPFGTSDGTLVENSPVTSPFGVSNTIDLDQRLRHIPKAKRYPMPVMPPRFEPTFGRWNHYHLPSVDSNDSNDYYPRVTTIGKTLDDTEFLDKWKTNKLIEGLATYPEMLNLVDPIRLAEGDSATLSLVENLVERARVAVGTSNAANFGTAVHAWTEAVDHGLCRIIDVPLELRAHVAAYIFACRSAGITAIPSLIERIIYNPYTGSAGRIDRISRMPDGTLVVLDVKTGKNVRSSILGIGVQLAQYATATHMLSEDGTHWEAPPPMSQTLAIVAHIPSNATAEEGVPCELVDIDLERAIADMMASVDVRERRSGKKNLITGIRHRAVSNGVVSPVESEIWGHIQSAQTAEHMRAIYAHYVQVWEPHFTEWGMVRLRSLGIV
jgi:hypothetical protein